VLIGNRILVIGSIFKYKKLFFYPINEFLWATLRGFASYDSVTHVLMQDITEELQQLRANLILGNFRGSVRVPVRRSAFLAAKIL
jgi:hypothetical protein